MPPDVLAKVRSLAQILQQGLKEGKISDTDIQQGLMSGQQRWLRLVGQFLPVLKWRLADC